VRCLGWRVCAFTAAFNSLQCTSGLAICARSKAQGLGSAVIREGSALGRVCLQFCISIVSSCNSMVCLASTVFSYPLAHLLSDVMVSSWFLLFDSLTCGL